jgi:hypothetical protein
MDARMKSIFAFSLSMFCAVAAAQESALHADFRGEGDRISSSCKIQTAKSLLGCGVELFTDHPLHIAAGSLPPQNGFGLGLAFVGGKNTTDWRDSWDIDAIASSKASYRAGGYLTMIHTPPVHIHVVEAGTPVGGTPKPQKPRPASDFVHPYTAVDLYAQTISLNQLFYFGLGNNSSPQGETAYMMSETIAGMSAIKPVFELSAIRRLNLSLNGAMNGRFVGLGGNSSATVPSIGVLYTASTAPGLNSQPVMVQFQEGLRLEPQIGNRFQINYLGSFEQYAASSASHHSFLRWTADLNHTFSLYGHTQSAYGHTQSAASAATSRGPDQCADDPCPAVSYSQNLSGSIGVRLLLSESAYSSSSTVPFYFQPTLGGSDIDGQTMLPSYQDYRFRAPNLIYLKGSFEHSVWGPLGFAANWDEGKVELARSQFDFDHLKHSFAAGLTIRAGGFPMVTVLFAWGGHEGNHTTFMMNPSLLGGSARPSLF